MTMDGASVVILDPEVTFLGAFVHSMCDLAMDPDHRDFTMLGNRRQKRLYHHALTIKQVRPEFSGAAAFGVRGGDGERICGNVDPVGVHGSPRHQRLDDQIVPA